MTGSHIPVPPLSLLAAKFFAAVAIGAGAMPPGLPAPPALLIGTSPSSPLAAAGFAGMPQFGALVWQKPDGSPGAKLCSAVAVDSAGGDLIATAAHCLGGVVSRIAAPMTVAYIPGADNGSAPYGVWYPTRIIRPQQWMNGVKNPDFDLAFVTVARPGDPRPLAAVTGSEHFGAIPAAGTLAVQIGYPYQSPDPVACRTPVRFLSPTQLELDCADFSGGSSGGPVLTNVDPGTGVGTLVGVMGGYEHGGERSDVTYASAFTPAIQQLYQQASQY
ncbi:MAG TPA: serine protease [Actinospica sp.]|jgi:V8-like Glu-specific endopeptidase|nr:serine protease [Actinospica sp.]